MRKVLTPSRLTRFGWAMVVALVLGFVVFLLSAEGTTPAFGERVGGDWAPFRAAGVLFAQDPALVLDPTAQLREMAPYLDGGLLPFANPPIFAALFVPAGWVSFTTGYVIYVVVLATAAFLGTRATLDVLGVEDPRWRTVGLLGAMTWLITFRAYSGAQNATLTLLVLAVGFRRLSLGQPWLAGIVFGALWYKPQFAVPLIGLLAVARHWRAAAVATGMGGLLWAANAVVFGANWTTDWFERIVRLTDEGNQAFNSQHTVSLVEYARWTIGGDNGTIVSLGLAAVLGLGFAVWAWRWREPALLLPITCVALLVTAAHALVYELTLLIPVIGAGLVARGNRGVPVAVGWWLAGGIALTVVQPTLRMSFLLAVAAWALASRRHRLSTSHTAP